MARVLEPFYDATEQTQYREGDEYDGPEEKKRVMREQGLIGERMTDEPSGERFENQRWREDYSDAQTVAGQLDVDIALNSPHDDLIEAIEDEIG